YKALDDIARERKLEPEERQEQKKYSRMADAFTPLAKGTNSEYANQNAYDSIQIHGGSGFMLEYACQRLYRDARITSIYEGTTQLQVVAAIRYITNGTYLTILRELEEESVSAEMQPLFDRAKVLADKLEACVNTVKEAANQELQDLAARHLYDITANAMMAHLIVLDASRAPELFAKSARVFLNLAEAEVAKNEKYVANLSVEQIEDYK
ncbi:MAG: acyl-CoA dehydrogenase, partial [Bacteroidaceae bacterium]|nr:acyl-CoA dehydrogenase [Bacteroidaceae bacterium]